MSIIEKTNKINASIKPFLENLPSPNTYIDQVKARFVKEATKKNAVKVVDKKTKEIVVTTVGKVVKENAEENVVKNVVKNVKKRPQKKQLPTDFPDSPNNLIPIASKRGYNLRSRKGPPQK